MIDKQKVACIIPARLKATRFPRKMLSQLGGRPLLAHVWERANSVALFDHVVFAVDSQEIADLIEGFGGNYLMTSESCPSGTDRLIEVMKRGDVQADIWVNWQGDEPFIGEQMILDLLQTAEKCDSDVWTLKKRIVSPVEIYNPHMAKVVCDANGFALYFSRSTIPFYRDATPDHLKVFFKHVGIYAFTQSALEKLSAMEPCPLEQAEQLEQLRFLYNGLRIKAHETDREVMGIDLPEDLAKAEAFLANLQASVV